VSDRPINVLVVDDSEDYVELCHDFLRRYNYLTNCDYSHPCWECEKQPTCTLKHAHDWAETTEILGRNKQAPDVILLDINFDIEVERLLPEKQRTAAAEDASLKKRLRTRQGFHILEALRKDFGTIPVVLMTAQKNVALTEPTLFEELKEHRFTEMLDDEGVNAQALAARIESLSRRRESGGSSGQFFWGKTPAMTRLRQWLEIFSQGDQPILLLGETGTGKSYLAEHVVHSIARPDGPFCALDLAALPDNLVAAELFGTARGAFSDAVDRPGRFEYAHGGTLFLDEIANLSLDTQKRLLGVLQDRRVTRLGENRSRPVDVKLIVATNEDLEGLVRKGSFRADLYQRLNPAAKVEIPPLRQRLVDLPELLQVLTSRLFESSGNRRLLDSYAQLFGLRKGTPASALVGRKKAPKRHTVGFRLAGAAEQAMRGSNWAGNMRQLELVWTNAVTYQLVEQIAVGRVGDSPVIGMDPQLIQELIRSSSVAEDGSAEVSQHEPERVVVEIEPGASLNDVSRLVEAQYFEELYVRGGESFDRMALRLLKGDPVKNARRVQLRFNNLGLSTRALRKRQ